MRIILAGAFGLLGLYSWLLVEGLAVRHVSVPVLTEYWSLIGSPGSKNFVAFIDGTRVAASLLVGAAFGYTLARVLPYPRWIGVVAFVCVPNAYLLLDAARGEFLPPIDGVRLVYSDPATWAFFACAAFCALRLRGLVEQQPGA